MGRISSSVIDDAFFQPDWAGACWGRWARPGLMLAGWSTGSWIVELGMGPLLRWSTGSGCGELLQKNQKEEGLAGASPVAAPMPKLVSL